MTTQATNSESTGKQAPPKPLPRPERKDLTAPFWEATKRGELVCQRCRQCGNWIFYPREQCPVCFSRELEWAPVSGRGRVHSFTVVHQPANAAFEPDAPYVYAVIQLDEGVRMVSNVVGCAPADVTVDMPVTAVFEEASPEWTLVKFKPA
jgi:uncharacterized OB-fold protein